MKGVWTCTGCEERREQDEPPALHCKHGWVSCEGPDGIGCAPGKCHQCDRDREFLAD